MRVYTVQTLVTTVWHETKPRQTKPGPVYIELECRLAIDGPLFFDYLNSEKTVLFQW